MSIEIKQKTRKLIHEMAKRNRKIKEKFGLKAIIFVSIISFAFSDFFAFIFKLLLKVSLPLWFRLLFALSLFMILYYKHAYEFTFKEKKKNGNN